MGASGIEKHFNFCRADGGVDSDFSMEPFPNGAARTRNREGLEKVHGAPRSRRNQSRVHLKYRRSLYIARDMKAGEKFTRENLRAVRPDSA